MRRARWKRIQKGPLNDTKAKKISEITADGARSLGIKDRCGKEEVTPVWEGKRRVTEVQRSMEEATAVDPWTTACSPERMIFPGALAVTSIRASPCKLEIRPDEKRPDLPPTSVIGCAITKWEMEMNYLECESWKLDTLPRLSRRKTKLRYYYSFFSPFFNNHISLFAGWPNLAACHFPLEPGWRVGETCDTR